MLLSISPPAAEEKRRPEDKDVPLLSLTHFCRPPFVSFGCVRPGSARSAVLLLQNPSADPAQVTVDKLPRERGFSVRESELLVPPFETVPLTITWTPLEEGGVRELVTFLLNNVVKHQAVLLGRAELPVKRKRNRWNTIRKETSVRSKTSEFKTKVSCSKGSKNKTFSASHKGGHGALERARSSLQSCENLSKPASSPSPIRESRRGSENRVPADLVDPLANQLQDFTSGSLRRSKTYSVLCTTEYSETLQDVPTASSTQADALIEEEWTLGEPRLSKESLSPINPVPNQQCNFICTPSISHEHTSYPTLSPTEFFKAEVTVKPSQTSCSSQESSREHCRSILSRSCTPPAVLQTPQRNALSPDSFVSNSYMVSEEYLTAASHTSILSPDQFVKDNFMTPPAELGARGAFSLNTPCKSSVSQEEVTMTQFEYIDQKSLDGSIEVLEPASSRLTFCVKKQRGNFRHLSNDKTVPKGHGKPPIIPATVTKGKTGDGISRHLGPQSVLTNDTTGTINPVKPPVINVRDGSGKQHGLWSPLEEDGDDAVDMKYLPRLPIISNTVTKVKPDNDGENQPKPLTNDETSTKDPVKPSIASATVVKVKAVNCVETQQKPQPKSRRRLKDIESDGSDDPQIILLSDLPVISVSDYSVPSSISGSESSIKVSKPKSICGHKRRSEEISRDASVTSNDTLQNTATQAKKVHISKPTPSRHGNTQGQRSKTANLALKSTGKIHKVRADTMKAKPTVAKTQKASDTAGPPLPLAVTFKNSKRIVAVAQSKLMFMKPPKTVIPRHPMPFAAQNMFYDERWMAKQERGFTWWLNFILTPDDFAVKTDSMKVNAAALILGAESNHKVSVPKAPTKEEVSLKAYTARCRLNKLRRSACRLFTSEPVVRAVRRLEVEIEARRLLVRKDRHLWKDIGERQKVLNWLLSYNPLWLRIGLETIYGELISLESNSDVTGLALFILNRLLWNLDIAAEYRHPSVPHLYRDGHEEALSKFTLKKLLLLFFFLDYAKQSRLIDHDPCLFCKDAEFKASKDLLLAFSRDFLSGEGDLSRHLSYLGLAVGHVQTPLHEFDFAVTNLAVDLQCGVRLVRTMELLTQNWSLSKKLRVPAISRLQKMHNVEVALQVLTERGVQIKDERGVTFTSKDVVDRHRERTLALLWHIVFTFQVDVFLNIEHLKEEIKFLTDRYGVQKQLASLRAFSSSTIARNRDSDPFLPDNYSERVLLLMEWVNAVCAFYSTKVENFTVSFSDGRVFCYLINHYHPSYLPANAISQRTTQTVECSKTGTVGLNSSSDSDNSSDVYLGMDEQAFTSSLFEELLENEKANFSLVQNAVSDLGGIPAMIHPSDMSNTIPDEKVVIIYLSFLCARLLDLRKEARAARVIQAAWRRHRLVAEEQLLQKKHKAARVLQRAACKFLAQRRVLRRISSAVLIQKRWRRYLAYKKLVELRTRRQKDIETRAAVIIQKRWRSFAALQSYRSFKVHVVLMQARVRSKIAVASYKRTVNAARTIQAHVRSWLLARKERKRYLHLRSATALIQSAYRKWKRVKTNRENRAASVLQKACRRWQERKLKAKTTAAIAIQSQYRMLQERRKYLTMRAAAVRMQSLFKMRRERKGYLVLKQTAIFMQRLIRANNSMLQERKNYLRRRRACVTIQSVVRGYLVRQQVKVWHSAATRLQAGYRMHKARKEYLTVHRAAVVLQRRIRAHNHFLHHRKTFLLMKWSALRLQATYRSNVLRKRMRIRHAAAIVIQANYKCYVARKQYQKMLRSALTIQSWYRGQKQKKKEMDYFVKAKWAIAVIQSAYRGFKVRRQVHKQHAAAVVIQSAFRRSLALRKFEELKKATVTIQQRYRAVLIGRRQRKKYLHTCRMVKKLQALWRGRKVRREFAKLHRAASLIQSYYKMHVCQTKYKTLKRSAERIQSRYRAYLSLKRQRSRYLKMKIATIVLQAAYRGWKARKNVWDLHKAACTIQTFYLSYTIRKRYLKIRKSATTIQRWYRNTIAARMQREEYVHLRKNVIKLQSIYRGVKTRQRVIQMHKSATLIQSVFKMHKQRVEYQKWRQAAVVIQQHYRAVLQGRMLQSQYMNLKEAACTIQAAWRGRSLRKRIGCMHGAATLIQSQYRMFRQQRHFKKLRKATIVVQRRYRACQERNKQMRLYSNMRGAALCIQTSFRTMKLQREFKAKRKAARVIQGAVRSLIERRRFLALRNAAICVQKRYKLKKLASHHRQEFIQLRTAVLVLQAAYRGFRERKNLQEMHSAAAIIQSVFRMRKTRAEYQNLKSASIVLQRYYRSYRSALYEREAFLKLRESAIKLQSVYRGAKARREITKMHQAASKIQATCKMYLCKRIYKKTQWAVCVMQRRYRAKKMMNIEMLRYSSIRDATICIQASYRGWHVRKALRKQRKAARIIQRQYRTYVEHKQYLKLKKTVICVQRLYRATAVACQCYRSYRSMRKAASCIQAAYRGYKVRKDLDVKHRMATRIQACFRMHRNVVVYRAQREAACKIQMWYRSVVECRQIRGRFLKLYSSVITIQAAFRGMRVRQNIKTMNEAAIVIQSSYRMYVHHTYYKSLLKATKNLQWRYRAKKARDWDLSLYQTAKRSAILLQAAFRGAKVRKQIKIMHYAATSIQKCVKAYLQRERYRRLRAATVCLQRRYRALILARSERSNFLAVRKAATCIQSTWRAYKTKERRKQENRAAAVIQASYRMYRQRKSYITLQQAARKMQLRFRANLLRQEAVKQFTALKKATLCIQSAFRTMKKREESRRTAAALVIQATFKMHQKRKAFLQIKSAAVVIQAALRAYLIRKKFKEVKASACCIQNWFRRCRQTSLQRDRYLTVRASAIVIQSAFRGLLARRIVQQEKAARKLQAYLRMAVCRRRFLLLKKSAVKLQSHYRMHRARKLYHRQRASAVLLQRWYRSLHVTREQRMAYLRVRRQVICLQSAMRCFYAQRRFMKARWAAVIIQAHWRRYAQRKLFFQYRWATLIIQQRYRAHVLQVLHRHHYMKLRMSAVLLQAAFRGSQIRALIRRERAACVIQRFYRSSVVRRKSITLIRTVETLQRWVRVKQERARFIRIRKAAVCIQRRWRETLVSRNIRREFLQKQEARILQSAYRGYVVRREVACLNRQRHLLRFTSAVRRHLCAVRIQRFFRNHLVLKKAQEQIASVIYIQRWYRSRLQQRNFRITRQKITVLQHAVRAWLQRRHTAAITIQRRFRLFIQRRELAKVRNGILKFQALWRGYQWRKRHDTKTVKKLRLRLQQVNGQIKEEDKLCNRTMIALNYLLTYKHISFILAALQHLEVATRLSSVCCENMAQSGAVKTIFTLIRSCNRSIPCMDVIKLSIQVLLNLSKYEGTVCAVYGVENSVEILLNLMQIYREKAGDKVSDKGGSIFTKTCCLLAMFALNTQRAREICAIPKVIDRICSIYKLTARKHRMDAARNIRQQLMNSSHCIGNISAQATPVRTRIVSRIKPDWVLRKDNMREVVDPLKAVQMVMLTLGMSV
ncbi:abnormal spindle-like microcephaly-associated protein isoform X2 [Eleutherodactylus coqui]